MALDKESTFDYDYLVSDKHYFTLTARAKGDKKPTGAGNNGHRARERLTKEKENDTLKRVCFLSAFVNRSFFC